mgnify:CR=1 FL=1
MVRPSAIKKMVFLLVQRGLLRFWLLQRRVHQPNVPVVNANLLFGGTGVLLRLFRGVLRGKQPELLVGDAPWHIVLIELLEQCHQLTVSPFRGVNLPLDMGDFLSDFGGILAGDMLGASPTPSKFLPKEIRFPARCPASPRAAPGLAG